MLVPAFVGMVLVALIVGSAQAAEPEVIPLARLSHIHGLAADPADPKRLYVATHHGLYLAGPGPTAARVSQTTDDLMGFSPHPGRPGVFYASGHPAGGGNLGVIISSDSGRSWQPLSPGAGGPVDFHGLAVSPANPMVLYGVFRGLQVSRNGGLTWQTVGPAPERLIALAGGADNADTLFAATESGLQISRDGGKRWSRAHPEARPFTAVTTAPDKSVWAYAYGLGVLRADAEGKSWERLGALTGDDHLLYLVAANDRLYGLSRAGLMTSGDGGKSWQPFGS